MKIRQFAKLSGARIYWALIALGSFGPVVSRNALYELFWGVCQRAVCFWSSVGLGVLVSRSSLAVWENSFFFRSEQHTGHATAVAVWAAEWISMNDLYVTEQRSAQQPHGLITRVF